MIFSAVRSNEEGRLGFLDNLRRINVALTRAKHGLIIVGNSRTLSSDPKWQTLIEFFKISGVFARNIAEARMMIQAKGEMDVFKY